MNGKQLNEHQMTLKRQLEYGDVTKLSEILGVSKTTIHNVISGLRKGDYVWKEMEDLINDREKKRTERANSIKESM